MVFDTGTVSLGLYDSRYYDLLGRALWQGGEVPGGRLALRGYLFPMFATGLTLISPIIYYLVQTLCVATGVVFLLRAERALTNCIRVTPLTLDIEGEDLVVRAPGRVPNNDTLNLPAIGVEATRKGIKVSDHMRSISNPRVFAAGDCADSGPNLTPVFANEARIVGKTQLAGSHVRPIKYPSYASDLGSMA